MPIAQIWYTESHINDMTFLTLKEPIMKICCKCKEEKSFENFCLQKRGEKKYYASTCRKCSAERSNKWYYENKEKANENRKQHYLNHRDEALRKQKDRYEKNYVEIRKRANERNRLPENREKNRIRTQKYVENNKDKIRVRTGQWKRDNPEKSSAYLHVMWALKLGVLEKPKSCQSCNKEIKVEAHHEDYSKPLEIMWLCKICHETLHHKEKYGSSTSD